ncbi:YcxB family protein [Kordia sp. YSTF-M3]|uniref:YcxB family protein n=1 Tax=Kordia aestuariivivens TaxID=2759037 RepID=A0ABR7QC87_9FLAO|nr:YcxB family protein [Kordia aestuariivivens]MBC8756191.1 YcxB family protein [Kordia aestuariivivens]
MVATKAYHLTKKMYRAILFSQLKRNSIQLIPFLLYLTLLLGWERTRFIGLCSICTLVFVGLCILLWCFFKNLKPFFAETQLQFDQNKFQLTKNDGTSAWLFVDIRNAVDNEKYWLVYLTMNSYIYIPKDIFYTEEDQHTFKAHIKA